MQIQHLFATSFNVKHRFHFAFKSSQSFHTICSILIDTFCSSIVWPNAAPFSAIGASLADKLPTNYGSPAPAPLPSYGADQPTYGAEPSADELNLKMLMNSVPGTPGEDYPILSEVPETAFSCKGQKVGGKQLNHDSGIRSPSQED